MIKQAIKQAVRMLGENPLVRSVSILGTALSIAMIMVLVLVFQIRSAGYAPESQRSRMLYVPMGTAEAFRSEESNNGSLSEEVIRECFYPLRTPETVTAFSRDDKSLSLPGKTFFEEYRVVYTDPPFWRIFDFRFLEGRPFTEADFQSGLPSAVVSSRVAAHLFGTVDVVGKELMLDFVAYRIAGVVEPVSRAASLAYGEVWVPYSSNASLMRNFHNDGINGSFRVVLLARQTADFRSIEEELERHTARYNASKTDYRLKYLVPPLSRMDMAMGSDGFHRVEWTEYIWETGSLLLFLLLVPALNLTGIVQASVEKRRSEVGLRKAFGATNRVLIRQILYENLVVTLLGGLLGLAFSFFLLSGCKTFLIGNDIETTGEMLFKPGLFLVALLFILLLNVLSAGIPALRTARQPIVDALKGENKV